MEIKGIITFSDSQIPSISEPAENVVICNNGWLSLDLQGSGSANNSSILLAAFCSENKGIDFRHNNLPDGLLAQLNSGAPSARDFFEELKVVVWYNESEHTLILSRDIFGTVPLYYLHIPGSFIAFSSSLVTLVNMQICRPYLDVDSQRVLSYCSFRKDQASGYSSRTFYKYIKTVLPGHCLSVTSSDTASTPYTGFHPEKWEHFNKIEDYARAFNSLFRESVRRISDGTRELIGSHLSGGLDSSSVSAMLREVAPHRRLHTLYSDSRTKYTDEITFASSVARHIDSEHDEIVPPENDFETISLYTGLYGHPECMTISPLPQGSLLARANELGCKTLLMGHGGDSVVGSGLELTHLAFLSEDWNELQGLISERVKQVGMQATFPEWDSYSAALKYKYYLRNFVVNRYLDLVRSLSVLGAWRLRRRISKNLDVPMWCFIKNGFTRVVEKLRSGSSLPRNLLTEKIAKQPETDRDSTMASFSASYPEKYRRCMNEVYNCQALILNEQFFALGNYYGVHNCFPLYDKELFELCMTAPAKIKFGDGIGRQHFREAMKGILPEDVRRRSSKANFSLYGRQAAIRLYRQSASLMQNTSGSIWNYIDQKKFEQAVTILLADHAPEYQHNRSQFLVFRAISLAIWLDWLKGIKET